MKKAVIAGLMLLFIFGFSGCCDKPSAILDNSNKTYFVDFYTDGDRACIECVLNVYNPRDKEIKVNISALDNEDVKNGLLKSPTLIAVDKTNGDDTFVLKSGENQLSVIFKGEYAGVFQITEREVPRFIIIDSI